MKLNQFILVADAIEKINDVTGTDNIEEIVDALTGVAFSEEEAGQIKRYHAYDDE